MVLTIRLEHSRHYNRLQHIATHRISLYLTARHTGAHHGADNTPRNFAATDCNSLQHIATHRTTLQHNTTHTGAHYGASNPHRTFAALQHIATHRVTLHFAASHCNTLQHTQERIMALTTRLELSRQALSGLQDKKGHRVAGNLE